VSTFRDGNLQTYSFHLAISLPALPGNCSGGGGDSDGLGGIAADCAVVADASLVFRDLSDPVLQPAKQYGDSELCKSSVVGRFYPFTGLKGLRAIVGAI
jgi:hypothetical protein